MPALSNPRHERFAQELVKGATADEAYQLAGYAANRGNAVRLKTNESVQARVREIQERASVRAEISIATATEDLLRLAKKAESKDSEAGFQAARGAIMDAAKLNGLIVDQSVTDNVNRHYAVSAEPEAADADEWAQRHRPN